MKRIFAILSAAVLAFSCSSGPSVKVTLENTTGVDRSEEVVELDLEAVKSQMAVEGDVALAVYDPSGDLIPSQVTYDGKLIFQADVAPSSSATYKITVGEAKKFESKVFGRQFPERVDDFAWENDRIAFRIYGPALQATGERAYGNDVWVKSTPELVVEERYRKELDPEMVAKIKELRETDEAAALELQNTISYHVDHGNGMDCYKVGPTLGAGGAALMDKGAIVYPYCYKDYEILDNGPLRLTVKFTFTPIEIGKNNNVIETRVLTVDAGSQFNKSTVSYVNLRRAAPIVAGIVMAGGKGRQTKVSKEGGFAAYADVDRDAEQGAIYVGTILTTPAKSAGIMPFVNDDPLQKQLGMTGHVALIGEYVPTTEFTYYWGAAWEKYNITTFDEWVDCVEAKSVTVKSPLVVTIK
ncbi:MAG: DUF4861 family protein [Rikenellaceae bacterium]